VLSPGASGGRTRARGSWSPAPEVDGDARVGARARDLHDLALAELGVADAGALGELAGRGGPADRLARWARTAASFASIEPRHAPPAAEAAAPGLVVERESSQSSAWSDRWTCSDPTSSRKRLGIVRSVDAADRPVAGAGDLQALHGARDADEREAAFFLEGRVGLERAGVGERALLEPDHRDDGELEPLRGVQGHQRHGALGGVHGVGVGDERDRLEPGPEQREQGGISGFLARLEPRRRRGRRRVVGGVVLVLELAADEISSSRLSRRSMSDSAPLVFACLL
jgi:hypothetical protein